MILRLGCVIAVASYCVFSTPNSQWIEANQKDGRNYFNDITGLSTSGVDGFDLVDEIPLTDYPERQRWKRAIGGPFAPLYLGFKAWRQLTAGSTRLKTTTPNLRIYKKDGDYDTALQLFRSLDPQNVWAWKHPEGKMGMTGQVGDRTVELRTIGRKQTTIKTYKTKDQGDYGDGKVDLIRFVD